MADRKNFSLRPRLPKTARKSKFVLPKSHYIYLCTYSVILTKLNVHLPCLSLSYMDCLAGPPHRGNLANSLQTICILRASFCKPTTHSGSVLLVLGTDNRITAIL